MQRVWMKFSAVVAFSCATLTLGCGGESDGPRVQVKGSVTYADKPLKTGVVIFSPVGSTADKPLPEARGEIDAQGNYELRSDDGKSGVPVGAYNVGVVSAVPSDPKNEYSVPKSVIPPKYNNPASSGIKLDIAEGAPSEKFQIKLR